MSIQELFGLGFLMIGLVSLSSYTDDMAIVRIPWFYKELKPMQERWGKSLGTTLHILGYVVPPIGFGILFLIGVGTF